MYFFHIVLRISNTLNCGQHLCRKKEWCSNHWFYFGKSFILQGPTLYLSTGSPFGFSHYSKLNFYGGACIQWYKFVLNVIHVISMSMISSSADPLISPFPYFPFHWTSVSLHPLSTPYHFLNTDYSFSVTSIVLRKLWKITLWFFGEL